MSLSDKAKGVKPSPTLVAGVLGAGVLGMIQGAGMEKIVIEALIDSVIKGDFKGILVFATIFMVFFQMRGLRKELAKMNQNLSTSLHAGELRFEKIEMEQQSFEHRLTILEQTLAKGV